MIKKNSLQIVPDVIYFRDLKPGESDSTDVWVTNIGRNPAQLRFTLPKDCPFRISSKPVMMLAPGLETKVTLVYTAKNSESVESTLKIDHPQGPVSVPVVAIPPCPRITSDKQKIDLGQVSVASTTKFTFVLSNVGVVEGEFELTCDNEHVEIVQSSGKIHPSKSVEITCNFTPPEVKDYRSLITINTKNKFEKVEPIEVIATSVQHSLALMVDDKEVSELNFETIYFGQKRVITATVVNRGPYKRSFVVLPPTDNPRNEKANAGGENLEIFQAIPSEGLLGPHGSAVVKFVFNPPIPEKEEEDFESEFMQYSSIEVVETHQRLQFQLEGKAVHFRVSFSSVDFQFEKIQAKEKATQVLTIQNLSHFLPVSYEMKPVAHFRFEPSKGTIKPQSNKNVSIVFYPKNFGIFQTGTTIKFCTGLLKKVINLVASCGTEDKQFKRIPVYEQSEELKFQVMHPDTRFAYDLNEIKQRQEKKKEYDAYLTDSEEKREKIKRKKELEATMRKRATEDLSRTMGEFTESDIQEYIKNELEKKMGDYVDDLDSISKEGFEPPEPPLSRKPEVLYLEKPEKFGLTGTIASSHQTLTNRSTEKFDENVLIKKKFKAKPTTPAEVSDCTKPLAPAQQLMVTASHRIIDFGRLSVFATVAKSFTVTNNLDQSILVAIKHDYEVLEKTTPMSQVIPPRQTAGFDITFCSKKAENFMKTVEYVINGHHTCAFNVSAQVVPIEVQLSRQMIDFRFAPDSTEPIIKEYISIQNKSDARAEFSWNMPSGPFSIQNSPTFVEGQKAATIEVVYRPTNRSHDEGTFVLNVNGGPSRTLKCVGDVGSPKCALSKKNLRLGLIPVGIVKDHQVRIKNTSEDDAIFVVQIPKDHPELQVSPMNGRVSAHESHNLEVTYKPLSVTNFDIPVTISICGGSDLTFSVTGQSELPNVQMTNTEFDFGRVFVGSSGSISATISNVGAIPAVLLLDLSNQPEFRIEFPTDLSDDGENTNKNSISLISDPFFVTKMEDVGGYMNSEPVLPVATPAAESQRAESGGLMYKIQLQERTTIVFNLIFQPTQVNDHSFELPISLMNVVGSSSFHLQPIVSAEAILAPIIISKTSLSFGIAPLYRPENPNCPPVGQIVSLTNDTKDSVKWHFDVSNIHFLEPCAFKVTPSNGELGAGDAAQVRIDFLPRKAMPYSVCLPLYVTMDERDNLIGHIQLNGVGTAQVFRLSVSEICFPVVPLGMKVESEFSLVNLASVNATLRAELPVDSSKFPVKVKFPEGNVLTFTTQQLPIIISFQSSKPISFSTQVAIMDDNGHVASLAVTCTTDNSVFTLYPYLSNRSKNRTEATTSRKVSEGCELTARFSSAADFMDLKGQPWNPSFPPIMIPFFQRYMNALMLTNPLSDFPGDLVRGQGQLIMDALANLIGTGGGKKPQTVETARRDQRGEDQTIKRQEAVKNLIQTLQGVGALISELKPEFLLSRTDFMQVMRSKVTKQLLGIDYFNAPALGSFDQKMYSEYISSKEFSNAMVDRLKVLEGLYDGLSAESWMIIVVQVFKLFVMSRVDVDKMMNVPGVNDAVKQLKQMVSGLDNGKEILNEAVKPRVGSNILSAKELGLLRWVSLHYWTTSGDFSTKLGDYDALRNSLGLASLVRVHTNVFLGNLHTKPADKEQMEQNAMEVASSMKHLKLAFCPVSKEIVDGTQCMMATTIAYLYSVLPHYLPSANLEFNSTVHKTLVKSVSLSNPSKSEIMYRAKLEGDSAFTLPEETVTIAPGKTVEFPIQFTARTVKPLTSRLFLIPSRPRHITPTDDDGSGSPHKAPQYSAPVVIDLVSSVTMDEPEATMEMESPIYQPASLTIPVKNVLASKASLKVHMIVEKLPDETGSSAPNSKPLTQQVLDIVNENKEEVEEEEPSKDFKDFDVVMANHQPFIISAKTLELASAGSCGKLELEFVPINVGSFRCLLIFVDRDRGEFVYEVKAKCVLPPPVDLPNLKIRCEAGKKIQFGIPIDVMNPSLLKSLVYSCEKLAFLRNPTTERKFHDMMTRRLHELEASFKQKFTGARYSLSSSAPQYFDFSSDFTLCKLSATMASSRTNNIMATFKPTKPGEYPCKVLMAGSTIPSDIRCFRFKGVGVLPVKELSLEFSTFAGRPVKQEIPFSNPSNEQWQYKVTLRGDASFAAPQKLVVRPQSSASLTVTFSAVKKGSFEGEMTVVNLNKDFTQIYKLSAVAEEPPAEERFQFQCKARQKATFPLLIRPFITNGEIKVSSTVPLIEFPETITITEGTLDPPFVFTIYPPRSGLLAGTLTFTDTATNNYIWYVVEIDVSSPSPEQTIQVETMARQSAVVSIPIKNTKNVPVKFTVSITDEEISGDKEFVLNPMSRTDYHLTVTPIKAGSRTVSIFFYTDDGNEFWYSVHIVGKEPQENIMAPVTASIGSAASVFVELSNPSNVTATFRIENTNNSIWRPNTKPVFQIPAKSNKRIELKYLPTNIGVKEPATITFKSNECGNWVYKVIGTGKPPPPLSPTIVSSPVNQTNSALVLFTNPFPYPSRFSLSMAGEAADSEGDLFQFLVKKKVFSLSSYGEEFQIPFTFTPSKLGQFKTSIIVASLGPQKAALPELEAIPSIRWVYPVIGNSMSTSVSDAKVLRCRAQQQLEQRLTFTLIGETEQFELNEYAISVEMPGGAEFISSILDFKPVAIERNEMTADLIFDVKFSPQRPLQHTIQVIVKNPLKQEWKFSVDLIVDLGTPMASITVESLLNKTGTAKVEIPVAFRAPTPFHIYFAAGSASEFSLSASHGVMEPGPMGITQLPVEILFSPKMYGKLLKALLVVDTVDTQYLFDVVGKTPDYVPPVATKSTVEGRRSAAEAKKPRKRNIIRDNIENVRITRPKLAETK